MFSQHKEVYLLSPKVNRSLSCTVICSMNRFTDLDHICSVPEMVVVVFITFLPDLALIQSLSSGPSQSFLHILLHKDTGPILQIQGEISQKIYAVVKTILYIHFLKKCSFSYCQHFGFAFSKLFFFLKCVEFEWFIRHYTNILFHSLNDRTSSCVVNSAVSNALPASKCLHFPGFSLSNHSSRRLLILLKTSWICVLSHFFAPNVFMSSAKERCTSLHHTRHCNI